MTGARVSGFFICGGSTVREGLASAIDIGVNGAQYPNLPGPFANSLLLMLEASEPGGIDLAISCERPSGETDQWFAGELGPEGERVDMDPRMPITAAFSFPFALRAIHEEGVHIFRATLTQDEVTSSSEVRFMVMLGAPSEPSI